MRGEHVVSVPPLSLPAAAAGASADDLSQFEAIQLFVERARGVRPDFRLTDDNAAAVAEICRRLDGLPLAIELATARLNLFSPDALRDRLAGSFKALGSGARDLPERQQTLRATIEWSYQLLTPAEQRLLRAAVGLRRSLGRGGRGGGVGPGRRGRHGARCPRRPRLAPRQEPRPAARRDRGRRDAAGRHARDDQGIRHGPARYAAGLRRGGSRGPRPLLRGPRARRRRPSRPPPSSTTSGSPGRTRLAGRTSSDWATCARRCGRSTRRAAGITRRSSSPTISSRSGRRRRSVPTTGRPS